MRQTPIDDLVLDGDDPFVPGTVHEDDGQMRRGLFVSPDDDEQRAEYTLYDSHGECVCSFNLCEPAADATFRQALLIALRDLLDRVDPVEAV